MKLWVICLQPHVLLGRGDLQRRDGPQLFVVRFSVTARLGVDFSALLSAENRKEMSLYCGKALLIMIMQV